MIQIGLLEGGTTEKFFLPFVSSFPGVCLHEKILGHFVLAGQNLRTFMTILKSNLFSITNI